MCLYYCMLPGLHEMISSSLTLQTVLVNSSQLPVERPLSFDRLPESFQSVAKTFFVSNPIVKLYFDNFV
jgi:hypothetical protein